MSAIGRFIADFYQRNLFERIILYAFFSAFIVKLVFELGLGQWWFIQSQHIQWIFYSLLALDYVVSYRKVINIRVGLNPLSVFAVVCFVMVAHGLFVGVLRHNPPFVILNDAIPLLMIGLNILRMQSAAEYKPIDFRYLFHAVFLLAAGIFFMGFAGRLIGRPTQPALGSSAIFLPLIFASAIMLRPIPKWSMAIILLMMALLAGDLNRTAMTFMALVMGGYIAVKLVKAPVLAILLVVSAIMAVSVAWIFVPENSNTYKRIMALKNLDLSQRTGSVGERQAEWDAIRTELREKGRTIEWVGLGFGGTYEVKFTHEYMRNYGHAHYSWSWFSLRYGQSGFIYLVVLLAALSYNLWQGLRLRTVESVFVAFMCLIALLFCVTHINSVWLLSGVQFFYLGARRHAQALEAKAPGYKTSYAV